MDKIFQPGVDSTVFFSDDAPAENIRGFAEASFFRPGEADIRNTIEDYHRVRPGFRPTLIKTVMGGRLGDEISLLKQTGLPVLVVSGKEDRMAVPNYLADAPFPLWKDQLFELPEAAHTVHIDRAADFNSLLLQYARERLA
jgi:pimeloyl-ACP methyl ester carboxylesterase